MHEYTGSCHCGRIDFGFTGRVTVATVCNCSFCRTIGALWFGVEDACFSAGYGLDGAGVHRFGTNTAKHYFCTRCGSHPFSNPRLAPHAWAVNLRCVHAINLEALRIERFDGANWDDAARRWLQQRAR